MTYLQERFALKNGTKMPEEKAKPQPLKRTPLPKRSKPLPKQKKPIAKRSKKMEKEMAIYKPEMIAYLKKNPLCKVNMKGCTVEATCVHHTAGRTGEQLHNKKDWLPSCRHCNLQVEIKDLEARSKGLKKTRITKPKRK